MNSPLPPCSVLVSSCDAYRDIWPVFFRLYFKHAEGLKMPVRLVTDQCSYADERVEMLHTGEDPSWTTSLARALERVPEPYVLFLQEDFLLSKPINIPLFEEILSQFHAIQALTLEIDIRDVNGPSIEDTWFRESNAENLRSGLNATLWRREFLQEIVSPPGLNIWQAETRVRDCLRAGRRGMLFLTPETPPVISYVESVKGGFWKPDAVRFLRESGLEPDLRSRPCPPQGNGLFAKLTRSLLKRWMRRRKVPGTPASIVHPMAKAS